MAILFLLATGLQAQVKADDITGTWLSHGDKPAKFLIYRTNGKFYGKIVFLQEPTENGKPKLDKNNPDKNKQSRPLLGLELLSGFVFDIDKWNSGTIYDPENGKTYSCTLSLKDKNTLKLRGYIGISLLGRTEIWTRTE